MMIITHRCPFCLHGNLASYRHTSTSFDLQSAKVQQSHMLATRKCSDSVLTVACDVNKSKFWRKKRPLVLAAAAICRRPPLTPRLHPAAFRDSGKPHNSPRWRENKRLRSACHINTVFLQAEDNLKGGACHRGPLCFSSLASAGFSFTFDKQNLAHVLRHGSNAGR